MKTAYAWLAGAVAMGVVHGEAHGLPKPAAERPHVRLVDAWNRAIHLDALGVQPVLVVYEDKGSAEQNAALKRELSNLARGDRYRSKVRVVPIADLEGYDYWPVRGFVRDAVQEESAKVGIPIYCDWDGAARTALEVRRGVSSVVLYDASGRVAWRYEGSIPEPQRQEFFALLRQMVEGG